MLWLTLAWCEYMNKRTKSLGTKNTIENFTSRCHSYALHAHDDQPVEARPQQRPAQWALNVCWAREVLTGPLPFQVMKSVRSIMRKRMSLLVHYVSACYDIVSIKQQTSVHCYLFTDTLSWAEGGLRFLREGGRWDWHALTWLRSQPGQKTRSRTAHTDGVWRHFLLYMSWHR